jgi:hypothetical protein
MKKTMLILMAVASLCGCSGKHSYSSQTIANAKAEWPDDNLYSTIFGLSMATHGWLYDYASYTPKFPGARLIGLPIWTDRIFIVPEPYRHGISPLRTSRNTDDIITVWY